MSLRFNLVSGTKHNFYAFAARQLPAFRASTHTIHLFSLLFSSVLALLLLPQELLLHQPWINPWLGGRLIC